MLAISARIFASLGLWLYHCMSTLAKMTRLESCDLAHISHLIIDIITILAITWILYVGKVAKVRIYYLSRHLYRFS